MTANFQLLMLSPNLLKSQSPYAPSGEGGSVTANFQLLMLSTNLLKSQSPYVAGEGGVHDGQLLTFDAESKSAKIPKSLCSSGSRGGGQGGHGPPVPDKDYLLCTSWHYLLKNLLYQLNNEF